MLNRREFLKAAGAAVAWTTVGFNDPSDAKSSNPGKNSPNVLLLFSDQHNAGVLGCQGHPDVITPNLDALASKGVMFSRAYCQDAVCGPSRR